MVTQARKPDRRVQRTRHLLSAALMQLIAEKGYNNLTVQDITDKADVARTTFYLHFKDIDDLLFSSVTEMIQAEVMQGNVPFNVAALTDPQESYINAADFEHVARHADFYATMLSQRGSMAFLLRVQDYIAQLTRKSFAECLEPDVNPPVPLDLLAYFCAGAEIGVMTWWLKHNKMQLPPATMAKLCDRITMRGLGDALGLSMGEKEGA